MWDVLIVVLKAAESIPDTIFKLWLIPDHLDGSTPILSWSQCSEITFWTKLDGGNKYIDICTDNANGKSLFDFRQGIPDIQLKQNNLRGS